MENIFIAMYAVRDPMNVFAIYIDAIFVVNILAYVEKLLNYVRLV